MTPLRIFISSVQKEFADERRALRDYLRGDALMRRFFEPFLFEEVPAADRRADDLYLDEVERCDIYVGLFGNDYGFEDAEGISPTQREFELATRRHKHRLIFVKGADDKQKHPKMQALIRSAGAQLIRHRFVSSAELIGALYAALIQLLENKELIRLDPFDAAVCRNATLDDLSSDRITRFLGIARRAPGFPLAQDADRRHVLEHLQLLTTIRRKPKRASESVGGQVTGEVTGQVTGEVTGEVAGEVTGEVAGEVAKLLLVCREPMTRKQLQTALSLRSEENFRKLYLVPALEGGYIEMTIPEKPNSRLQKYRLAAKGTSLWAALGKKRPKP